ncbi:F-box/kelch-repeat protein At3g23880-like [Pyrus communis]|uniref:F-box/kelch-repeat protein At3g23880-like n=1 Tax=Pyrus communis TaxID=23211 RepID=UPI0035BF5A78
MAGDDGDLPIFFSSNDDIFVEILSWLPVISLLRFRCVCKSWRDIISTSQFVAKHRAHTNDNSKNVLILFKRPYPLPHDWPPIPFRFPRLTDYQSLKKNVGATSAAASSAIRSSRRDLEDEFAFDTSLYSSSLVGSSNGLICLLLDWPRPPRDYYRCYVNTRLLLWNPSTRTARKLPDIDWFRYNPFYYGFGYDSITQDYKVLLGGQDPNGCELVAIFALKTGSWKSVEDPLGLEAASLDIHDRGCFLNGALHWHKYYCYEDEDWNEDETGYMRTRIVSFDFAQEKFHSFSFIKHKGHTGMAGGVGTIGNRLFFYTSCYTSTNRPDLEEAGLTIWVMREYGVDQSWTIFAKIRPEIFPPNVKWLNPIFHMEDDGAVLMQSSQGDLVLYMRKEEREEEDTCRIVLKISDVGELPARYEETVMYADTLVSPVIGGG